MTRAALSFPQAAKARPGSAILAAHGASARIPEEVFSPLAHHQRKEIGYE
ncbi:hypothetical protein [Novosphingobium pokkalii]|uniref:Uncharacterized protein n=1 Tax=Novosphingobium pokkalii TaxID=1770194 RepID=A0ABV7V204_9SPHN|nr:hypothetical protein [Novosphingobium pokkalii]